MVFFLTSLGDSLKEPVIKLFYIDILNTNIKSELVVVDWVMIVLHNLGFELHVGAGHEEHPDVGVKL